MNKDLLSAQTQAAANLAKTKGAAPAALCAAEKTSVGRPKSQQKRFDILYAASHLFLEQGFSSTSMDLVAQRAGVSKQTVYSHFNNKDALFSAVITHKCTEYQLDQEHMSDTQMAPLEALLQVGHQLMRLLQDPQVIAMHRVVIGEAATAPRVAKLFFDAGPQNGMALLSGFLFNNQHLDLNAEQAEYFSCAYFNLLKGDFHLRSLLGLTYSMSEEEQDEHVNRAAKNVLLMIRHLGSDSAI